MRFPKFVFCSLMLALSVGVAQAQDCDGQCFRTPVRNGLAAVAQAQPVRSTVKAAANAVGNTVEFFAANKPVRRGLATFGVQRVSSQSSLATCNCGCATVGCDCQQSSFRVGGYDTDGLLILSISDPTPTLAPPEPSAEVSALGVRKRRASREVIVEAAMRANQAGTISTDELRAIRLACMSPRMLAKIEDLIIEKAQNSGAYTFAHNGEVDKAAIDWEAIGDFILKIAPIIFKLIELFALDTSIDNSVQFASAVEQAPNFVATAGNLSLYC